MRVVSVQFKGYFGVLVDFSAYGYEFRLQCADSCLYFCCAHCFLT